MGDFFAFGGGPPTSNNDVIFIIRLGRLTENLSCYVNWLEDLAVESSVTESFVGWGRLR